MPPSTLAPALAVFDFQNNQDGLNDTKGNKIEASLTKLPSLKVHSFTLT